MLARNQLVWALASLVVLALWQCPAGCEARHKHTSPQPRHGEHETTTTTKSPDRPDDETGGLKIDAFDLNICGRDTLAGRMSNESAFGCSSSSNSNSSSERGGDNRKNRPHHLHGPIGDMSTLHEDDGEYPYRVRVAVYFMQKLSDECSGIIVHKDLVLTSDRCMRAIFGGPFERSVRVILGQKFLHRPDREYRATRICRPGVDQQDKGINIALLKLDRPIDYAKERVAPVCLRLSQSHTDSAECTIVDSDFLGGTPKRGCKSIPEQQLGSGDTCYGDSRLGLFRNKFQDIGGPLVCYDKCGADKSTRAFAVGVIKKTEYETEKQKERYAIVSDLYKQREGFEALVRDAISGKNCYREYDRGDEKS